MIPFAEEICEVGLGRSSSPVNSCAIGSRGLLVAGFLMSHHKEAFAMNGRCAHRELNSCQVVYFEKEVL